MWPIPIVRESISWWSAMVELVPVEHDPFNDPPANLIPVDHDPFVDSPFALGPPDPVQWQGVGTVPRIVVHPKAPPSVPAPDDGTDNWVAPGTAFDDSPDDWFVPTASALSTESGAQSAANPGSSNPPGRRPDPLAAYWSLIPASRAGAMAWHPPIFLRDPPTAPASPQASPPWTGLQSVPTSGGIQGGWAQLGSPNTDPGGTFPPVPPQQSTYGQAVPPLGRRPLADYSTGEILGDAAKSFGVGVGRAGIQGAGLLGDAREMIANGAQRAADYFAPGSAPNTGSKVSDFLSSNPLLGGPTSQQLQSAIEAYTGPFYKPKTIVGDYAQTAGEFAPGALAIPEGTLAANALRYGLLPALSSETAGQLTKGTAAEPWARTLGAILGAAPGVWRDLPWTRSAPAVAEPLVENELFLAKNIPQVTLNKAAGDAWEAEGTSKIIAKTQVMIQPQITIRSNGPSGLKVRLDAVGQDRMTGDIGLSDMKASKTAPLTPNQTIVYPELETHGGVVVGKGKAPYVGGRQITPTRVTILRKPGR
jgi:hypothetical protein